METSWIKYSNYGNQIIPNTHTAGALVYLIGDYCRLIKKVNKSCNSRRSKYNASVPKIYSTAKETWKLVTSKLFNNFDPRILVYIWSKPLCNECSLTMTSCYMPFLSTVAQNGHYQAQLVLSNFEKQVKAIEFLVVSRSYVWFGLFKASEFEFCHKRYKISRLWRKMRFSYTRPLSKPEASEINKQIRNMTKINAQNNSYEHGSFTGKCWHKS